MNFKKIADTSFKIYLESTFKGRKRGEDGNTKI